MRMTLLCVRNWNNWGVWKRDNGEEEKKHLKVSFLGILENLKI